MKKKGELIAKVPIQWGQVKTYEYKATEDISVLVKKASQNREEKFISKNELEAPIYIDSYLGNYEIYEEGIKIYDQEIYIKEQIARDSLAFYWDNPLQFIENFKYIWFCLMAMALLVFVSQYRNKH